MLSNLKSIIPGATHWPKFVKNESDRFEARFSLVEIQPSPSLFFDKMVGSRMLLQLLTARDAWSFRLTRIFKSQKIHSLP